MLSLCLIISIVLKTDIDVSQDTDDDDHHSYTKASEDNDDDDDDGVLCVSPMQALAAPTPCCPEAL